MVREFICPNCGFEGRPKRVIKGSIFVELILWIFLIIPGVIYSIWRLSSRYDACPKCAAPHMIPLDSPRGKKLIKEFESS
jgi:hypothetical protein